MHMDLLLFTHAAVFAARRGSRESVSCHGNAVHVCSQRCFSGAAAPTAMMQSQAFRRRHVPYCRQLYFPLSLRAPWISHGAPRPPATPAARPNPRGRQPGPRACTRAPRSDSPCSSPLGVDAKVILAPPCIFSRENR